MTSKLSNQSTADIKRYQGERLIEMLNYMEHHSPFYKDHLRRYNIQSNKLKSTDDLNQIPTIGKSEFSEGNFDFLCVPKNKIADYSTTSGTSGKPVTIALTENDLQRLAMNEMGSFACAGGMPGDLYQLMLTVDRQFMAGLAYLSGIRALGAGAIRVGPASPKMQWQSILEYRPNAIVVVPSFLLRLIEFAELNDIDLNRSGINRAICIGEAIRNGDLTVNNLAKRIHEKWDIQLFSTYASTEMQTAFTECTHQQGGHLQPELIIMEILNDRGNQLGPGEFGEVTITTLGVEGMPLLRYRTGDICCYYDEPCKCGRNTIRISPVVGRKNQMIKYNGTTFFPQAIYNALGAVTEVGDYLIEITKNDIGGNEITIHIYQNGDIEKVQELIKTSLRTFIRVFPALNFVSEEQIKQMKATDNRKPTSVIFR